MHQDSLVKAVCSRCHTDLVPAFRGRLRCPRASACGFGGISEDAAALRAFNAKRTRRATDGVIHVAFTPRPVRSPVSA